jgi:ABC-type transport system involved in multi-copper enzyme maturation permease subunit
MKSLTIAFATAKEAIRRSSFFVLAFIAALLLVLTIFVPYFTFGEDIKMYKDTGLATISFFCLLLALLTASSSVAEEIEGKTAVTVLSKPINRRQFIIGKFLGIEMSVLAMYLILGTLFSLGVWYKTGYDLRESPGTDQGTMMRSAQVMQILRPLDPHLGGCFKAGGC